jgi:hypothetical protein
LESTRAAASAPSVRSSAFNESLTVAMKNAPNLE